MFSFSGSEDPPTGAKTYYLLLNLFDPEKCPELAFSWVSMRNVSCKDDLVKWNEVYSWAQIKLKISTDVQGVLGG